MISTCLLDCPTGPPTSFGVVVAVINVSKMGQRLVGMGKVRESNKPLWPLECGLGLFSVPVASCKAHVRDTWYFLFDSTGLFFFVNLLILGGIRERRRKKSQSLARCGKCTA